MKQKQRDLQGLLIGLNACTNMGFKYPIGNKELCIKVRQLESDGVIQYNALYQKWSQKKAA